MAIQEFSTTADAKLLRDGKLVNVRLGSEGDALLHFKLIVKLSGDVTKRQLAFAIPPALSSKVAVTIDEPDADLEFPTAVAFKRDSGEHQTKVDAILGSGDRVDLSWTPRVKRITEMAASIFVQNHSLVTVGGDVVNTRSFFDYQISQGELRQAKIQIPADQRLLRVEGEWIRTWEINPEGKAQVLVVDLVKGVTPTYRVVVETEKVLDKLPASVSLTVPQAMNVIRETGTVGVRGGEELTLTIENPDLQRIDAAEFSKNYPEKIGEIVSAYRFLKPGFEFLARAEPVTPQVEAVVRNSFRIGFEQLNLAGTIDYAIKKAGVFTLRFSIPADYRLESVLSGTNALSWIEKEPRLIEVTLPERTIGSYSLSANLSRTYKDVPKTLELFGVRPVEVQKLAGYISVMTESGIAVKTSSFDGLLEIPTSALGATVKAGNAVLAFKYLNPDAQNSGAWKLVLTTEAVDSWVRSEVVDVLSVSETLLSGRAVIRYDIQNAPTKEFRLNVPNRYKNIEILGTNIRRRDQTGEEWRVELQNKVRGSFVLTVTFEQPFDTKTNSTIEITGVGVAGVERETGQVVLMTKPPLQFTFDFHWSEGGRGED